MKAMILTQPGAPLEPADLPCPSPGPTEILIRVSACGVCRTDLHVVDGELASPKPRLVPGHEIVGRVTAAGSEATRFKIGDRIGVPWLGWACGNCEFCRRSQENLCESARFTGYQLDGGYAEFVKADERFCVPIPERYGDVEAAPLLCAGLIGYRALRLAGDGPRLGLYGFGASAHIVIQIARHRGQEAFVFTVPGDAEAQAFARRLGAAWVGGSDEMPPAPLDAAIIFAPVGDLVPAALRAIRKGGTVICAGIHMSDIPRFPYALLWPERTIHAIANLTRQDAEAFMAVAAEVPIHTETLAIPLDQANEALARLRGGQLTGAAVLVPPRDPAV
ncbi:MULTISPECIES: zinc-dependent alcohol dehydrogenase family protein [Inquilinus]|uniref:alcohol dehydrogenase n=1 Tax=Inquilinus ginsengisoli TaxID=363840 RepID=A0ABU1JHS9_9PROT|nr:zinc-dependent alcohol dehydrogenase family protein [Inquilinus ginsengisoli]MDR6288182.1 propanol-preferring alcohol dehydrogenase [Inquilinus ginsengisoli]